MHELSQKEYWTGLYEKAPASAGAWRPRWLLRSYADVLLWDHLIASVMPAGKKPKAIELGSAPGSHLIRLYHQFGCEVYGAEYTESGVAQNRALFAAHGIDAGHVIQANIFDEGFQREYKHSFDVVFSCGLIEHFEDAVPPLQAHAQLAKPGGTVIVVIPNLRGIHYGLTVLFNRSLLSIHNLTLMRRKNFEQALRAAGLTMQYCSHYGVFNFDLHNTAPQSMKRHLLRMCKLGCLPLQWMLRALHGYGWFETALFSPYLVCIGQAARG